MDRIYRELAVNNAIEPRVHLDTFILKITVNKSEVRVTEKVSDVIEKDEKLTEKVIENADRVTEKVPDVIEKRNRVIENVIEKAKDEGFSMTDTHIKLLQLMSENPYVSQAELAKVLNVTSRTVARNIETLRGKYLNRVGPDKGGFWEVIAD